MIDQDHVFEGGRLQPLAIQLWEKQDGRQLHRKLHQERVGLETGGLLFAFADFVHDLSSSVLCYPVVQLGCVLSSVISQVDRRYFNFHDLTSSVLLYLVVQLRLGCVLLSADISQVDNLHERLSNVSTVLQDIGPVWYFVHIWLSWFCKFCIFRKNEFISLYNFLPWYALANVLLIVGGIKVQNIHSILTTRKTCSSTFWSFKFDIFSLLGDQRSSINLDGRYGTTSFSKNMRKYEISHI